MSFPIPACCWRVIQSLVFGSALAFGLEARLAAAEVLTWTKSVQETSRNNAELRTAKENLNAAQQGVKGSRANYYPQVTGSVGTTYSQTRTPGQPLAANDPQEGYNASLSIAQNLFSGWADTARVDQAKSQLSVSNLQLAVEKARISSELKAAYAGLILAQRSTKLQLDIIRRREENLRLVELRYESGRENKGSVLLSQAYLDQARFEALQAKNNLRVAQTEVARILGRDGPSDFQVNDEVPTGNPGTLPDFRAVALQTPEAQQALARLEGAQAELVVSRAGYFPNVSLSGSIGRQGEEWFPESEAWSLGLTLSYPLFSGGRDRAASTAAVAQVNAATETRLTVQRTLLTQLEQTFSAWTEAVESLKVESSFREAAAMRAEIARNKYNNGLISFEDWDLIESELIGRQRSVLTSQRQRVVAEASWERIQGKGVIP